jgi:archaellum biogenesis ATPase FlaH
LRRVKLNLGGGFLLDTFDPSGDEVLDDALGGGFPKWSLILVAGEPGTGKTVFAT